MDDIEYIEANDLPAAVLSLDIEKVFHSVWYDFLLKVMRCFNFGDNFLKWVIHFTHGGRVMS